MENIKVNNESLRNKLDIALNGFFDNFEDSIQQEIDDTEGRNSWLDCFATQVSKIQLIFAQNASREKFFQISDIISKGPFGSEEINVMKNKYGDNLTEEIKKDQIEKFKKYILQIMDDNF